MVAALDGAANRTGGSQPPGSSGRAMRNDRGMARLAAGGSGRLALMLRWASITGSVRLNVEPAQFSVAPAASSGAGLRSRPIGSMIATAMG
jgi:hypothetical protein